jgi:hypothetical protein
MVATVVYTVVGDTVFIRMVWISGTGPAELVVLRTVSRVSLVTLIPSTSVQLLILGITADTFLEKNPNYTVAKQLTIDWLFFIL